MAGAPEPLSAVDAAWLRMDRPSNLMMISAVMRLDGRLDLATLKRVVRERMLCFHRFRQRVVDDGAARWETDPALDLDWHVQRSARHAPLEQAIGTLASSPLDPARPMWQFHLADDGAHSAVILRIHHCYADGFALLYLADALTDADPARPRAPPDDLVPPEPPRAAWERMLGPVSEVAGDALRLSRAAVGSGAGLLAHPLAGLDYARAGAGLLRQAGIIAAMAPDAATRLKGPLGTAKQVAWAEPLPLDAVKAVASLLDCSVNDVLVSCFAGAVQAWLAAVGDGPADAPIRALVPVNLRPPGRLTELGNRFGLVFLELPGAIADPVERTREVHRRMAELKHSQQPLVALGILAGMGVAPAQLRERVLQALAANASMVLTNVHGPDQPRYLAGRRIAAQLFWVPQSGGIGLGASILSYAGQVGFGVIADRLRVPDPGALARGFSGAFDQLLLAALMLPWPGESRRAKQRELR